MEHEMKPSRKIAPKHTKKDQNRSKSKRRSTRIQNIQTTELHSEESSTLLPSTTCFSHSSESEGDSCDTYDQNQVSTRKNSEELSESPLKDIFDLKSPNKVFKTNKSAKDTKNFRRTNDYNAILPGGGIHTENVSKVFKIISKPSITSPEIPTSSKSPLKTYTNPRKSSEKIEAIESFGLPDTPLGFSLPNNVQLSQPQLDHILDTEILDAKEITIQDLEFAEQPWCIIDLEEAFSITEEIRIKTQPQNDLNFDYPTKDIEDFVNNDIIYSTPQKDKSQHKWVALDKKHLKKTPTIKNNVNVANSKREIVIANHCLTIEDEVEIFNSGSIKNSLDSTSIKTNRSAQKAGDKKQEKLLQSGNKYQVTSSEDEEGHYKSSNKSKISQKVSDKKKHRRILQSDKEQHLKSRIHYQTNNKPTTLKKSKDDIDLIELKDIDLSSPKRILRSSSCIDLSKLESDGPVSQKFSSKQVSSRNKIGSIELKRSSSCLGLEILESSVLKTSKKKINSVANSSDHQSGESVTEMPILRKIKTTNNSMCSVELEDIDLFNKGKKFKHINNLKKSKSQTDLSKNSLNAESDIHKRTLKVVNQFEQKASNKILNDSPKQLKVTLYPLRLRSTSKVSGSPQTAASIKAKNAFNSVKKIVTKLFDEKNGAVCSEIESNLDPPISDKLKKDKTNITSEMMSPDNDKDIEHISITNKTKVSENSHILEKASSNKITKGKNLTDPTAEMDELRNVIAKLNANEGRKSKIVANAKLNKYFVWKSQSIGVSSKDNTVAIENNDDNKKIDLAEEVSSETSIDDCVFSPDRILRRRTVGEQSDKKPKTIQSVVQMKPDVSLQVDNTKKFGISGIPRRKLFTGDYKKGSKTTQKASESKESVPEDKKNQETNKRGEDNQKSLPEDNENCRKIKKLDNKTDNVKTTDQVKAKISLPSKNKKLTKNNKGVEADQKEVSLDDKSRKIHKSTKTKEDCQKQLFEESNNKLREQAKNVEVQNKNDLRKERNKEVIENVIKASDSKFNLVNNDCNKIKNVKSSKTLVKENREDKTIGSAKRVEDSQSDILKNPGEQDKFKNHTIQDQIDPIQKDININKTKNTKIKTNNCNVSTKDRKQEIENISDAFDEEVMTINENVCKETTSSVSKNKRSKTSTDDKFNGQRLNVESEISGSSKVPNHKTKDINDFDLILDDESFHIKTRSKGGLGELKNETELSCDESDVFPTRTRSKTSLGRRINEHHEDESDSEIEKNVSPRRTRSKTSLGHRINDSRQTNLEEKINKYSDHLLDAILEKHITPKKIGRGITDNILEKSSKTNENYWNLTDGCFLDISPRITRSKVSLGEKFSENANYTVSKTSTEPINITSSPFKLSQPSKVTKSKSIKDQLTSKNHQELEIIGVAIPLSSATSTEDTGSKETLNNTNNAKCETSIKDDKVDNLNDHSAVVSVADNENLDTNISLENDKVQKTGQGNSLEIKGDEVVEENSNSELQETNPKADITVKNNNLSVDNACADDKTISSEDSSKPNESKLSSEDKLPISVSVDSVTSTEALSSEIQEQCTENKSKNEEVSTEIVTSKDIKIITSENSEPSDKQSENEKNVAKSVTNLEKETPVDNATNNKIISSINQEQSNELQLTCEQKLENETGVAKIVTENTSLDDKPDESNNDIQKGNLETISPNGTILTIEHGIQENSADSNNDLNKNINNVDTSFIQKQDLNASPEDTLKGDVESHQTETEKSDNSTALDEPSCDNLEKDVNENDGVSENVEEKNQSGVVSLVETNLAERLGPEAPNVSANSEKACTTILKDNTTQHEGSFTCGTSENESFSCVDKNNDESAIKNYLEKSPEEKEKPEDKQTADNSQIDITPQVIYKESESDIPIENISGVSKRGRPRKRRRSANQEYIQVCEGRQNETGLGEIKDSTQNSTLTKRNVTKIRRRKRARSRWSRGLLSPSSTHRMSTANEAKRQIEGKITNEVLTDTVESINTEDEEDSDDTALSSDEVEKNEQPNNFALEDSHSENVLSKTLENNSVVEKSASVGGEIKACEENAKCEDILRTVKPQDSLEENLKIIQDKKEANEDGAKEPRQSLDVHTENVPSISNNALDETIIKDNGNLEHQVTTNKSTEGTVTYAILTDTIEVTLKRGRPRKELAVVTTKRGRPRKEIPVSNSETVAVTENCARSSEIKIKGKDIPHGAKSRKSIEPQMQDKVNVLKRSKSVGSAVHFPRNITTHVFDPKLGRHAWARIGRFPFWPCIITRDPNTKSFIKTATRGNKQINYYHVRFFGDRGRRSWVSNNNLMKYKSKDDLQKKYDNLKDVKNHGDLQCFHVRNSLLKAWTTAVEEIELVRAQKYKLKQTLEFFKKANPIKPKRVKKPVNLEANISETELPVNKTNQGEDSSFRDSSLESDTSAIEDLPLTKRIKLNLKSSPDIPEQEKPPKASVSNEPEDGLPTIKGKQVKKKTVKETEAIATDQPSEEIKTDQATVAVQPEPPKIEVVTIKDEISGEEYKVTETCFKNFGSYSLEEQKALFKRNHLFKGIPKEKCCQFCFNFGDVYKCKGGCNGIYHLRCAMQVLIDKEPKRRKIRSPSGKGDNVEEVKKVEKAEASTLGSQSEIDEGHVQIITVPSRLNVCGTPPRKTFPPDCANMTLGERIDYKMKEIMKKFESAAYLEMLSDGSDEKPSNSPLLRHKSFSKCQDLFSVGSQRSSKQCDLIDKELDAISKMDGQSPTTVKRIEESLERIFKPNLGKHVTADCDSPESPSPSSSNQGSFQGHVTADCDIATDANVEKNTKETLQTNRKLVKNRKSLPKHVRSESTSPNENKIPLHLPVETKLFNGKLNGARRSLLRHVTADSDCVVETADSESVRSYSSRQSKQSEISEYLESYKNFNPKHFKCGFCTEDIDPYCSICHDSVSKKGSNIRQKCSLYQCSRFYHPECLKLWPQTQWSLIQTTKNRHSLVEADSFVCPQHVCHTCSSDDPRASTARCSGDKIVKCLRCPASYHSTNLCVPAGTEIITSTQIVCPRHRTKSKNLTINTTWCFICNQGGNLICCETCPTSVHPECMTVNLTDDDKFICEDCESGRLPLYDEIVWVKVGQYKWWPGLVLFPNEVPLNVYNTKHSHGEFVVKFFGTYNHFWVNRGRSFLFQEGDTVDTGLNTKNKVEAVFRVAVEEAVVAHKMKKQFKSTQAAETASSLKPPPYIKIKVSKPVGNVKLMELNLSNATACACDPSQPNPCGPDSNCINRLLLTECNPEVCPAGKLCKNQSFEKREYPPMEPYKTETRGWGLRSLAPIKKGQFVIEYVGELIDDEEYQRRIQKMHEQKEENYYFLTIYTNRMIDAGPKGNVARFMNHCCQPNCETQKWTVNGETRVGLFANDDIPSHSELTFNYNLECTGKEKKVCQCGAPNCTGFIGGKIRQEPTEPKKPRKYLVKKKEPVEAKVLLTCFLCREKGDLDPCTNTFCKRAYHLECLELDKELEHKLGKKYCPWHYCNLCSRRTIRCCVSCMNSFCPTHSEGNISHNQLTGYVCRLHESLNSSKNTSKKKRGPVSSEDAIVTSTTDDNEDDEDSVPLLIRHKAKKMKKHSLVTANNFDPNDDALSENNFETDSQDETVSSATASDFENELKPKRKRAPRKMQRKRRKLKTKNEVTANSSTDSLNGSNAS